MTPIIIDFETLNTNVSKAICLSFSATVLDTSLTFQELQEKSFTCLFDLDDQKSYGRKASKSTLEWWDTLPKEVLKASIAKPGQGYTLGQFIEEFEAYVKSIQPIRDKVLLVCRGCSFDIQLINQIYRDFYKTEEINDLVPHRFWNEMDVRSFVKGALMTFENTKVPVETRLLEGFKKHNPLHDVCKDVILIQQVLEYACGKELPDTDIIML